MPQFHTDEIARLDDIETLLTTARELAHRFTGRELDETATRIGGAIVSLNLSRNRMIANRRTREAGA